MDNNSRTLTTALIKWFHIQVSNNILKPLIRSYDIHNTQETMYSWVYHLTCSLTPEWTEVSSAIITTKEMVVKPLNNISREQLNVLIPTTWKSSTCWQEALMSTTINPKHNTCNIQCAILSAANYNYPIDVSRTHEQQVVGMVTINYIVCRP